MKVKSPTIDPKPEATSSVRCNFTFENTVDCIVIVEFRHANTITQVIDFGTDIVISGYTSSLPCVYPLSCGNLTSANSEFNLDVGSTGAPNTWTLDVDPAQCGISVSPNKELIMRVVSIQGHLYPSSPWIASWNTSAHLGPFSTCCPTGYDVSHNGGNFIIRMGAGC